MRIAFVGSREFCDKDLVDRVTSKELQIKDEFVSGGAIGVDQWAEQAARDLNVVCWVLPPDWIKYGKRAGLMRNEHIVDMADKVIAFWDGESKGTKYTIDCAVRKGKPVDVYIRKEKNELHGSE